MLLFGRHPFLSPADMTLNPAEQMVKLIENTVKGQLQLPEAAEGSSAADLLRRILVPSPKQRYGIKDILIHPWFQVCAVASSGVGDILDGTCVDVRGGEPPCWGAMSATSAVMQ